MKKLVYFVCCLALLFKFCAATRAMQPPPRIGEGLNVAFSRDEQTLACVTDDFICLFNLRSGEMIRQWSRADSLTINTQTPIVFSADGTQLFCARRTTAAGEIPEKPSSWRDYRASIIERWDLATGALSGQSQVLPGLVWHLARRPDGQISLAIKTDSVSPSSVFSGLVGYRLDADGRAQQWWQLSEPHLGVAVLNADETALAVERGLDVEKSWRHEITLFSVPQMKPLQTFEGEFLFLEQLQFSPSGKILAAQGKGLNHSVVRGWDVQSAKQELFLANYNRRQRGLSLDLFAFDERIEESNFYGRRRNVVSTSGKWRATFDEYELKWQGEGTLHLKRPGDFGQPAV